MLSRLWGGRRADAFQNAVDGHVELSDRELTEFVDLAHAVREIPAVQLGTETRIAMRARLVAEAESVLTASPTPVRFVRPRKHRGLRVAVGATVVVTALSGGVVSVSANALPGDVLYPVKLGVERFETTFNGNPAEAGRTSFEHAATRLEEAEQLARAGEIDRISGALDDFVEEADGGADQLLRAFAADSDASSITAIRSFTHSSAGQLSALAELLDESTMPAYTEAVSTITSIDKRAVSTCPECSTEPPLDVPYNVEPDSGDSSFSLPPVMLPELDDRFFDDRQGGQLPDNVLTEPDVLPDAPPDQDDDDNTSPENDNGDNNGDDDNGHHNRPIRPHNGKDHGSVDGDRPDGDNDGGVLPDLPDLPTDPDGSDNELPGPRLHDVVGPLNNLLGKLGPLGALNDLLGPLLGDKDSLDDKHGTGPLEGLLGPLLGEDNNGDSDGEDSPGPLDGLLGDDDNGNSGDSEDGGDSDEEQQTPIEPDESDPDQGESDEQQTPIEPDESETEESGPLDGLDPVEESDDDSSDLDELDGVTDDGQ